MVCGSLGGYGKKSGWDFCENLQLYCRKVAGSVKGVPAAFKNDAVKAAGKPTFAELQTCGKYILTLAYYKQGETECQLGLGVESPQAVQKLYSLVDHSRPFKLSEAAKAQRNTVAKVSATHPPGSSPNPSPCPPRRQHRTNRIPSSSSAHGRTQSESMSSVLPVDLTAENSCVTTLLTPGGRISSTGEN